MKFKNWNPSEGFPAGNFVFTIDGYKDISQIKVNDFVLTQDRGYNRVLEVQRGFAETMCINGVGLVPMRGTLRSEILGKDSFTYLEDCSSVSIPVLPDKDTSYDHVRYFEQVVWLYGVHMREIMFDKNKSIHSFNIPVKNLASFLSNIPDISVRVGGLEEKTTDLEGIVTVSLADKYLMDKLSSFDIKDLQGLSRDRLELFFDGYIGEDDCVLCGNDLEDILTIVMQGIKVGYILDVVYDLAAQRFEIHKKNKCQSVELEGTRGVVNIEVEKGIESRLKMVYALKVDKTNTYTVNNIIVKGI